MVYLNELKLRIAEYWLLEIVTFFLQSCVILILFHFYMFLNLKFISFFLSTVFLLKFPQNKKINTNKIQII